MHEKIRVGILLSNTLCAWQYDVLQEISNANYIDILLKINLEKETYPKIPLAWKIFSDFDCFLFRPTPNALAPIFETIYVGNPLSFSTSEDIGSKDLEAYQLDVLINFTDIIPTQTIISSCKFGVWNIVYSNTNNKKQGPPGAWETILRQPEIEASLQCISESESIPKLLDYTSVCTDWISYSRNANLIHWHAAPLFIRNLKRLFDYRNLGFCESKDYNNFEALNIPNTTIEYPNPGLLIWHSTKTIYKKFVQLFEKQFYFNQWILLLNNIPDTSKFDLSQYTRILPPKDRFWADPFLIKRNGKYYIFIEELIYKDKLGHLSVMELDEKGKYTTPKIILKKDYHLSYPFLFEDDDNLYMIPETGSNKDIQLYKCTHFPYEWKLEKVLMEDVVAVDTTIYKKDNLYWMFTNLKEHKGMSSNVELFLFSSNELVSENWQSHPQNPISTDVKKSRPAGRLFVDGNKLIRPSQNCSHHYGYGMNMNLITQLDNTSFEEKIEDSINPKWVKDVLCTHTFNSCDDLTISDAQIRRSRFF